MPDAIERLQGGPQIPGLDAPPLLEPLELPELRPKLPVYEELVALALEHYLNLNPKKMREEVEAGLNENTDLLQGTDAYARALEATIGRRVAFRAHCFASEAADVLEALALERKAELAARPRREVIT